MAREQPETRLVRRIREAVKKEYPEVWSFKVNGNPMQRSGVPDVLFCVNGKFLGLEVKDPKPGETIEHARDRATALQKIEIAGIRKAGGRADVVTSVEEALRWVKVVLDLP